MFSTKNLFNVALLRANRNHGLFAWSRRSNFHGGQNEEFGRSGRSGRDIRSNDESGSAIQCIPGYQLLYRQDGCFYGAGFQGMISNVDLNGTADINHSMLKRAIASTPALSQKYR
jgi:hypothetical protein